MNDGTWLNDRQYLKWWWKDSRFAGNPPAPGAGGLPALRSFSSGKLNDCEVYWFKVVERYNSILLCRSESHLSSNDSDSKMAVGRLLRVMFSELRSWTEGDGLGLKKATSSQDWKKKGCKIVIDWSSIDKSVLIQLTTVRRSCRMWRDGNVCDFVDYLLQRLADHLKRCLLDDDFLQRLGTEIDRCWSDCNAWGPDFCQDAAIEHRNYRKQNDLRRIYRDDSKLKWASDGERQDGGWRMASHIDAESVSSSSSSANLSIVD